MEKEIRKTGIDIVGDVPWGTHLCQFYQTKEDLIDILVPYFKAGLKNNEFCMWVTSEPLTEKEAKEAMRKVVPNFEQYLKRGQMEIVPHTEWYLKDGSFDLQRILNAWIDKLNQALANGYDGMRVTGNTAWLEKRDWRNFADYEEEVNNVISKCRMLALCSYSLDKCGASELIDVVSNHQFAIIRREGKWELVQSSQRKQAEEREKQLQQELNLSSRLASIGEMASGIAHEINNPLTGVIGFAQLLMKKEIPDDIRNDLELINSQAQRVAKIVENLLAFARQHKPGREYVDVNNVISQVLELRSYEMKVCNIEVELQLAPDLPQTMADGNQLQQVFLNIILNAEKEMIGAHNRGKLQIKTEKINHSIRVSITDDGPGISEENIDKIFDPFFTTREVGNGTGLGLSICHGIITAHKGSIYAESELGEGATFIVELPIVANTELTEKVDIIKGEPRRQSGAKILVVDNETAIQTSSNAR